MTKFAKAFHLYGGGHTRRRRTTSLLLSLGLGLIVSAAVAGILYWMYYGDRFRP